MPVQVTGLKACIDALDITVNAMKEQAVSAGEEIADVLKAYAKANHPWKNDTGETEATTDAQVVKATKELVVIALFTGTDYSQFLELAKGGKYAWLFPAILANEGQIMQILARHVGSARR